MASVLAEEAELTESISPTSSWPLERSDFISSRCKQCRGYTHTQSIEAQITELPPWPQTIKNACHTELLNVPRAFEGFLSEEGIFSLVTEPGAFSFVAVLVLTGRPRDEVLL